MNKLQLINELAEEFKKNGYKTDITLKPGRNPLIEITRENKKIYITTCEVGIKPAKYKDIVFSGIRYSIQKLVELEKTYVVIIDFKPMKPKLILVKVDSTNYYRNAGTKQLIFNFKRPDYGGFYNTDSMGELTKEIEKEITNL